MEIAELPQSRSSYHSRVVVTLLSLAFVFMIGNRISQINVGGDSFLDGDWLINYEAGFVRRGFFGNFLFQFDLPAKDTLWLLLELQIILYGIILFAIFHISRANSSLNFNYMVLLSPVGFMFAFIDFRGGFRKEIILFAAVALLYLASVFHKKYLLVLSPILFYVGALSWEGIFFFSGVFALLFFRVLKGFSEVQLGRSISYIVQHAKPVTAFFVVGNALLLLFLFLRRGSEQSAASICESWIQNAHFGSSICTGAIGAIGWPVSRFLTDIQNAFPGYLIYAPILALALLPFLFLFREIWKTPFFLLVVLSSVPLFLLAVDFGRWISVIVVLLTFCVAICRPLELRRDIKVWLLWVYISTWGAMHWFVAPSWISLLGKLWSFITGETYPNYF